MTRHKYRPYLSREELGEIILSLKSQPSPARMGIIRYLEVFCLKISHGIIGAGYVRENTLEETLEGTEKPSRGLTILATESLYNKWKLAPKSCTPAELEAVMEYMYSNDLMTLQEEESYINIDTRTLKS